MKNSDIWDPIEMVEPPVTSEASIKLELCRDEKTGNISLMMTCGYDSPVCVATIAESGIGWTVTSNGLYLSYGPKDSMKTALVAALQSNEVLRMIICELIGDDDSDTSPMREVRHG